MPHASLCLGDMGQCPMWAWLAWLVPKPQLGQWAWLWAAPCGPVTPSLTPYPSWQQSYRLGAIPASVGPREATLSVIRMSPLPMPARPPCSRLFQLGAGAGSWVRLAPLAFLENGRSRQGGPSPCSRQGCLAGGSAPRPCAPPVLGSPRAAFLAWRAPGRRRPPRGARFHSGVLLASLCLT